MTSILAPSGYPTDIHHLSLSSLLPIVIIIIIIIIIIVVVVVVVVVISIISIIIIIIVIIINSYFLIARTSTGCKPKASVGTHFGPEGLIYKCKLTPLSLPISR